MDEPPRSTVEPVTQLALFQPGSPFLVLGVHLECRGFHQSVEETRLAAGRLAWSR